MQTYTTTGLLTIGQGTVVQLTEGQARDRTHRLEPLGEGRYRVLSLVQFKAGEVLGIEGPIPRVHLSLVQGLHPEPVVVPDPPAVSMARLTRFGHRAK